MDGLDGLRWWCVEGCKKYHVPSRAAGCRDPENEVLWECYDLRWLLSLPILIMFKYASPCITGKKLGNVYVMLGCDQW